MKSRKLLGFCVLVVSAMTASAAMLADFQMNDAANTKLQDLANDAPGGGRFNYGVTNMLADGNGLLVYTLGGTNGNYAHADLASAATSGVYKLSVSFNAATLSGSGGKLGYSVRDSGAGKDICLVQLIRNSGNKLLLLMNKWGANGSVISLTGAGTNSLPDVLNVEVEYDLDNDTVGYSWTMGSESGGTNLATLYDGVADVVRNAYNPDNMNDGDFIKVDYLTVESIPEPATMGLFGLAGGAVMFVRRRRMMAKTEIYHRK